MIRTTKTMTLLTSFLKFILRDLFNTARTPQAPLVLVGTATPVSQLLLLRRPLADLAGVSGRSRGRRPSEVVVR